jgi:hypothetical protein
MQSGWRLQAAGMPHLLRQIVGMQEDNYLHVRACLPGTEPWRLCPLQVLAEFSCCGIQLYLGSLAEEQAPLL